LRQHSGTLIDNAIARQIDFRETATFLGACLLTCCFCDGYRAESTAAKPTLKESVMPQFRLTLEFHFLAVDDDVCVLFAALALINNGAAEIVQFISDSRAAKVCIRRRHTLQGSTAAIQMESPDNSSFRNLKVTFPM
jgi:hypothetical protein